MAAEWNRSFFFFQAEDGIRDVAVTGVQTCALPICNIMNHDPLRPRTLLLHKKEIRRLIGQTQLKGLTLVPLRIYFSPRGLAKVELAVARGKKAYDRREAIKQREAGREMERAMKGGRRKR